MSVEDLTPYLEPVRKSIVVRRTAPEAFEVFTAGLGRWWPFVGYSIHGEETLTCTIEPRVGGQVFETSRSGERGLWGTVLVWEPPERLAMSWHPGNDPRFATEVEVRFTPIDGGTRVDLEHRDWSRLGARAVDVRGNYDRGWVEVFERCFSEACR